ncbi:unnamed protein product [Staurois parvus]|uniref:Uncharacterized protein n=1 Tax=Staurois parvus TaxID=386267 RepID=A0ABN9BJ71_9NEOB|nr:unnamed protein product [Staurois parvus]
MWPRQIGLRPKETCQGYLHCMPPSPGKARPTPAMLLWGHITA